jgi:hypothetical protein
MATLVAQQITEAGVIPTITDLAVASNDFLNSGNEFIYYANSSGSEKTITITSQISSVDNTMFGELTKANAVQVVANGETAFIGPFPTASFSDGDGLVTFAITSFVENEDAVAILYI